MTGLLHNSQPTGGSAAFQAMPAAVRLHSAARPAGMGAVGGGPCWSDRMNAGQGSFLHSWDRHGDGRLMWLLCLQSLRTSTRRPRLRLPSLLRQPLASVLFLGLLALAANQIGFDLFYGARVYLGSVAVVLALLLLGWRRGLVVGAASVLLVPRLWAEPQAAIVLLAEVLWLAFFLHPATKSVDRRECGDVVLADILFWVVIAIPLDFLLLGVFANVELPALLDLSFLQAINGTFNAAVAYALFMLIRIIQSRRDPSRSFSLQGLILISLVGLILVSALVPLTLSLRQLDRDVIHDQLARLQQVALNSVVLKVDALDDLSDLHRQTESSLDFQVLDGEGRVIYNSNPSLFRTLDALYAEPNHSAVRQPPLAEPLDLLIPVASRGASLAGLHGYWRYETSDDLESRAMPMSPSGRDERLVVVVEPARNGIRELQAQSSQAIRLLGLIMLGAAIAARGISRFLIAQFPPLPALQGFGADIGFSPVASGMPLAVGSVGSERLHSSLRELQPVLQVLRLRGDALIQLRESFRRSEGQRHHLEAEVGRLNIIDPLTGCFNRRELYRRLDHELRLSGREQRQLSFLCLEIDHLRHIQDSYGTFVSEEVLRRVALDLRNRSRTTDFVCRLGSEQFGLLLPACDATSAEKVARLLCDVVRALEIRHEELILSVTLSVGIGSVQTDRDDPDSLITRAQSALYRAKAEGRDRVVVVT